MKLYHIYNGWVGCSAVRVCVIAKSEQRAKELALEKFEKKEPIEKLAVELLCDDVSMEWASEEFDD